MASGRGGGGFGPSNNAAAPRALLLIIVAVVLGVVLLWRGLDQGTQIVSEQLISPTSTADLGSASEAEEGSTSGEEIVDGESANEPSVSDGSGDTTSDEMTADVAPTGEDEESQSGTASLFPAVTEPPSEVQILVANGSGSARAAGSVTELLVPKGYATLPPANAQLTDISMIYFRPGMVNEARAVMELLVPESPDLLSQIPPTGLAVADNALERLEVADIVVILGADGRIHSR